MTQPAPPDVEVERAVGAAGADQVERPGILLLDRHDGASGPLELIDRMIIPLFGAVMLA